MQSQYAKAKNVPLKLLSAARSRRHTGTRRVVRAQSMHFSLYNIVCFGFFPHTLSRREQLTNLYWSRIQGQTQARTRPGGCPAPVHGCQIVCGVRVERRLRRDACGIEEAD